MGGMDSPNTARTRKQFEDMFANDQELEDSSKPSAPVFIETANDEVIKVPKEVLPLSQTLLKAQEAWGQIRQDLFTGGVIKIKNISKNILIISLNLL